ncbi:M1 family metallopeptidase [Alteromonas lipotrueiana]|uniref:M1 family metallopeptidase n=1 Tax=Alteromonas lipotrueiana TaxID=2803815 RepID=UPI001C45ADCE|nr:M1 family metallopeptidase [Alteromonas lipotrueiana]
MRKFVAGLISLLVLSACATREPVIKGQPSRELSTPYTLKTGGFMPPLQRGVTLNHAELWFNFDFERNVLFGISELTLDSNRPKRTLSVDLDTRFKVEQVWINGSPVPLGNVKNPDGQLLITPQNAVAFPLKLKIQYFGRPRTPSNPPWEGGVLWDKTAEGQPWVVTTVQSEGCDLFWPCIDQPSGEPQQLDVHITVPKNLMAISNGTLQKTTQQKSAHTFHWHSDTPINTYGVALNIAPYKRLSTQFKSAFGNQYPLTYYYLPSADSDSKQAQTLLDELPEMLRFFEQYIGPYPFANDKVGIVQTPYLGMEHQTINAYGNQYKKDGYGFDWLMQHELAHEWFGNQLTTTNWDHMWLHEGLATYMQPAFAQYLHGDVAYFAYLNKIRTQLNNKYPLVSGRIKAEKEVYSKDKGPGLDLYYKGAWVMHTLRYYIGDEAFFAAVQELVYGQSDPTPGNITPRHANTKDFIALVNKHADKDLNWFFETYLYQAALPELTQERTASTLTLSWKTSAESQFTMPVQISINGSLQTLSMQQPTTLSVSALDTVIIDPHSRVLRYQPRFEELKKYQKKAKTK